MTSPLARLESPHHDLPDLEEGPVVLIEGRVALDHKVGTEAAHGDGFLQACVQVLQRRGCGYEVSAGVGVIHLSWVVLWWMFCGLLQCFRVMGYAG